ncbi:MAG: hypothetical protein GXO25_01170 [Euryarchaeota archaeon]|nr:hypothetical protein [Euryarchaeota archaeon]
MVLVVSALYFLGAMVYKDVRYILLAVGAMLLVALFIGLYDDFKGIRKWEKVPIFAVAAVPIILINYLISESELWTPIVFGIHFSSIFYWFIVIPVIVAGFANGGNVIAGYDGMETGIYSMISALYFVIGLVINSQIIIYMAGVLLFSLLSMLLFNWYPSKILLGNVGSFSIGAVLGIIPLIGHFEIVLPIVFLPHVIEVLLQIKYTRKYKYDVFGNVDENGIIHNKYGLKSIIHWIISWGNMTEKKITLAMLGIEALLCAVAFGVWYFVWF